MTKMTSMCCAVALGAASLCAYAAVTDGDKDFLMMAAQSDVNEIKLSQLAEQKASMPEVKAFAHKMVVEHMKLSASMKPFVMAWKLTPATDLDDDHKSVYADLNGKSGMDFDKAYIDAMDKDHHKALDAFTKEAEGTTDAKFKAAVIKGKTAVAAHTNMADSLKAKM